MEIDYTNALDSNAKIKVVGVGGGGGNAVQNMIDSGLEGVTFICANTDVQALNKSAAQHKVQLGEQLTRGLGAGSVPQVGKDAALESVNSIRDALLDSDMVFVTAGMGGGTGSGAAPVIAQAAKEIGALTVGVVTKPFTFEGAKRRANADNALQEFRQHVDCLIVIPNDRLLAFGPKKAPFKEMLKKANDVLYYAVKGISDVITKEGMINVDFADVKTTMENAGLTLMGTGVATGENRAREAAQSAIMSPLLEDVSLDGAKAVLYNVTSSEDLSMDEISEIGEIISEAADPEAHIIFGAVIDEAVGDELRITVIATGIDSHDRMQVKDTSSSVTNFRKPSAAAVPAQGVRRQPQVMAQQMTQQMTQQAAPQQMASNVVQPMAHAEAGGMGQAMSQGMGQNVAMPHSVGGHAMQPMAQGMTAQIHEENMHMMHSQPVSRPVRPTRRGQVESWYDGESELPPFVLKRDALGTQRRNSYVPGVKEGVYSEDEFEIPAFIRKGAD